jgi:galactosylceramidase
MTMIALLLPALAGGAVAQPITITLDPAKPGRTFEGIGGASAGASSRLLVDYPDPQRSEILDYLFKPNYGASLQSLKVEIGGDINSTDGVEPSHMHTRNDENYTRGYEWWLMKEAKKRNPDIILDCLAWGAPAWIGDGKYYSQDMADYVVKFIKGAQKVHGLGIQYTGIWNERPYDTAWIKLLRKTLDENGLGKVGIVVADQCQNQWEIAREINEDARLKAAAYAIGVHYPHATSTTNAMATGLPLWSSEDGPWSAEWNAAATGSETPLQVTYNRNYITGKMTKTEIWSPITSYYDNLPLPGSGLMRANTPWSGHYDLEPALWVTAHTTQFAQPGWKYLDSACLLLPGGGSCVALLAPNGSDYSIILETSDAKESQNLKIKLAGGLSNQRVHVWRSDGRQQFLMLEDIVAQDASMLITVEPDSVYSLTTTTGQRKGWAKPPPPASFPSNYKEDFAGCPPGSTPKYWSDYAGAFEVVKRGDGKGNALRQVIEKKGIEWQKNAFPESFCGEMEWEDYTISADALIEKAGFLSLFGRISLVHQNDDPPLGYWLKVADSGNWELLAAKTKLAGGVVPFSADTWHNLKLWFLGNLITVTIDGADAAKVEDNTFDHGNAGIGSGWHGSQFANLTIHSRPQPAMINLALGKPASASSQWGEEFAAGKANDGNLGTRWNSAEGKSADEWLEINLGQSTCFNRTVIRQFEDRITKYKVQYWDGSQWRDAVAGGSMQAIQRDNFPAVIASKVRLLVVATKDLQTPSIFEFAIYHEK